MALHLLLPFALPHRMRRAHRAEDQRDGHYCRALFSISELEYEMKGLICKDLPQVLNAVSMMSGDGLPGVWWFTLVEDFL